MPIINYCPEESHSQRKLYRLEYNDPFAEGVGQTRLLDAYILAENQEDALDIFAAYCSRNHPFAAELKEASAEQKEHSRLGVRKIDCLDTILLARDGGAANR